MIATGDPPGRDTALDAFRGLAVAGMALVNLQNPFGPSVPALTHAEWNGLTLADLVFPFFVLGVGLSTPLALDRPTGGPTAVGVLRRGVLLILIGIGLNWLLHPTPQVWNVRASGVLQRIGVVYLACALLAKAARGWRIVAAIAVALLAAHAVLLLSVPAPGTTAPSLLPGQGLSGWLDLKLLPGRIPRHGYDPEGVLSTLSAVAGGLIGVAVMRWRGGGGREGGRATVAMFVLGAALAMLGLALTPAFPLNKQLWTPSFALLTDGLGIIILALLTIGGRRWPGVALGSLAFFGRAALTFYVLHMLVIAALLRPVGGRRLWETLAAAPERLGLGPAAASLTTAAVLSLACVLITRWVVARGWALRL